MYLESPLVLGNYCFTKTSVCCVIVTCNQIQIISQEIDFYFFIQFLCQKMDAGIGVGS